ncbi:MAG: hypothetical protein LQ337_005399 [Flavoplaca oasis]|nr:MAG: hypothetical protein LQ337_005399 [Flavoplaca oasis]
MLSHGVYSRYGQFALGIFALFLLLHHQRHQYGLGPKAGGFSSHGTRAALDNIRKEISLEDFPKRIWTTSPLSPMRIQEDAADRVRTWMDLNPEHRYEMLTDGGAESYVKNSFADNSRIVETYMALDDFILRADLIRYLALWKDGGVYSDLDVGCNVPIDLWIPASFKNDTSVVVGIEADNDFGKGGNKLFGFVNWTLMSRRNQSFVRYLVEHVIRNLHQAALERHEALTDLKLYRQEVLDVTGPGALTRSIFQYLSEITKTTVDMQNFTKMERPRLIAGILFLPINAFGGGHQVQWSGANEDGSALVHHYFAGSWKGSHPEGPTEEEKKKEKKEEKN